MRGVGREEQHVTDSAAHPYSRRQRIAAGVRRRRASRAA
jgi:hypothetical protein